MVAIDCETTGLNPRRDRIVSFAAVRIAEGLRIVKPPLLDLLIDPGIDIPARATAIHGIDRADLLGAPSFGEAFQSIEASLAGAVVVGHFVGFDLAILGREAARAGKVWHEPPSFDTASLAASFGHSPEHNDLAALLALVNVEATGQRHRAADDARMAAQLFAALAHRLIGQGRGTYGGTAAAHRAPRR
ncbi:MAG TPA: 3'-5' exonuclease [Reyranella sp.]|nr:3'-5' exonuclease [Reyranella sp.]